MRKYVFKRFHVSLSIADLTDDQRDNLIAGIAKVAPSAAIIQNNPALLASATALNTKGTTFKASRAKAAGSRTVADADEAQANLDRGAVDAELISYAGMLEANAKSVEDLTSGGLPPRPPPAPPPPFAPPDTLDVFFPKKEKGKFRVSAHGAYSSHIVWVVEVTNDPTGATNWAEVHGPGKSRIVLGTSGTNVWVRYAMVRNGVKSAWGTAVLVTFP
jgi:hypothetical protein